MSPSSGTVDCVSDAKFGSYEVLLGRQMVYSAVKVTADGQIVYRTGRLRAAVMTANMVPYDWDWIENVRFKICSRPS